MKSAVLIDICLQSSSIHMYRYKSSSIHIIYLSAVLENDICKEAENAILIIHADIEQEVD